MVRETGQSGTEAIGMIRSDDAVKQKTDTPGYPFYVYPSQRKGDDFRIASFPEVEDLCQRCAIAWTKSASPLKPEFPIH